VSVSPRDVRDMLEIYGVPDSQRDTLVQLARESRQKGWWHAYGDSVLPHFATYLGLESAASEIRIYEVNLIPGLLQTEDYARAVISAGMVDRTLPDIERSVALRMERQQIARTNTPKLWAVLDEAALRREVGGSEVMRTQLEHLRELASTRNISIQVIPFRGGAHPAQGRPFIILAFDPDPDPDVVYLEDLTSALWVENVDEVDRYNIFFDHLCATALSFEDSAALMTAVLKEM
jgi:hypothetical protein